MNDELYFRCFKLCSGHYLSANIDDNWQQLSEEEQTEFLEDNVWQPFESYDVEYVRSCIEASAKVTQEFIEDLTNTKAS